MKLWMLSGCHVNGVRVTDDRFVVVVQENFLVFIFFYHLTLNLYSWLKLLIDHWKSSKISNGRFLVKMAPVKGSCDFCGRPSNPNNDVLYGPIHRMKDIKCHYYCLLFSSNLDQNGRDDEGILGFLLPDIKRELRRAKTVNCSYCRKPGGVTSCHANKCKKRFHLPCGLEKGSLHLFYDDFRSYCGEHRKKQRVPADVLSSRDVNCSICFDPIEDLTSNDSIWAPCCRKNGWFHRLCIQSGQVQRCHAKKWDIHTRPRCFMGA
ncbi:hypothetical protein J437_LFUL011283 [Ladona fulva]|uniref:PHD-type domain-containing protein n=1 Tax=Ladona fulva TaxID=123851 RepID=A0A8K0KMZ3_LADFU|nr:hypothetical protein J437_LFUL011283 [Ladona fulva]